MDDWLRFINDDDELGLTAVKVKSKAPTAEIHCTYNSQPIYIASFFDLLYRV